MGNWTRRDVLKSGMAAPAVAAAMPGAPDTPPQAAAGTPQTPEAGGQPPRERLLLDAGWRFHLGHAADMAKDFGFGRSGTFSKTGNFVAPGRVNFDDSDWAPVDLPHDWAVELPFKNDPALQSRGFYPMGRNYPETSIGWYRRVFELPAADAGKRITLEFDGVYRQAMVVFNNYFIGENACGYAPFRFDVTDFANPGGRNVLVLRVDATLSDGWFYEGAGIYRHVWLVKTEPVHVRQWGTLVRSDVRPSGTTLSIRTEVDNEGQGAKATRVISTVLDPSGKPVAKAAAAPVSIPEFGGHTYKQQVAIPKPALWSLAERNLYKLVTEVEAAGAVVDRYETTFGIRTIRFDGEKGFFLNGKSVKIKGTCNHQDHAGLGAALPDAVQDFRINKLKEMGCNGYRSSHNHPTPELLDACDRLGMLVMDETRMMSSNPEGLSQFERLVRRDRNHPSVILWSMGNEEGTATTVHGLRILTTMKRVAAAQDGSRPVSIAPPPGGNNLNKFGLSVLDVQGYNYADPGAEEFHKSNPNIPIYGSETVSAVATRGIYLLNKDKGYVGSYDPWTLTGRASAEGWWQFADARPWNAGGFIWTGFDYRGEPSPYGWPNISSQYGIIDTCGFPKDSFYYYQAWWTGKPVLHLLPHWNWPGLEGKEIIVWVYSNLEKVELFLNGKSLGAQQMQKDRHLSWRVTYAPGTLEARGFKGGQQVLTAKRETTGPAAKLVVRPDRREIAADGGDVAMFAVEVQDAEGRIVPLAENEVAFRVTGPAKLIGVGNGNPSSLESDKGSTRKAFCGLCMGIVQAGKETGNITVEATSPGLAAASASIAGKAAKPRPSAPPWVREIPAGTGVTGFWRPVPAAAPAGGGGFPGMGSDSVFTFRQEGSKLTGTVEGSAGGFGGGDQATAIEDGKVEGGTVSFRAGNASYTGTFSGGELKLERSFTGRGFGPGGRQQTPPAGAIQPLGGSGGAPPAVGPVPDGSDPSSAMFVAAQTGGAPAARRFGMMGPLVLRRATR
jgi:beta-galactosidase